MDKETTLLIRLAANHLFLAQFEPFRAIILTLQSKHPSLALSIIQTILFNGGRFDGILWSPSCPSPPLLTFLTSHLLLSLPPHPSLDQFTLFTKSEFLLYTHTISSKVSGVKIFDDPIDGFGENSEKTDDPVDRFVGRVDNCEVLVRVLEKIWELGLRRLRLELDVSVDNENDSGNVLVLGGGVLEESELECLRKAMVEYADVFEALCWNIEKQVKWWHDRRDNSGLAITLRNEERKGFDEDEEVDMKVMESIQRNVQVAHLEAMRECIDGGDVDGAVSHIRFLHLDYGVEEDEYRMILQGLLQKVLSERSGYDDNWVLVEEKLLLVYTEALSSNCTNLVQMIQVIQDELLSEEIESYRASDSNQIPPPLERLQRYIKELTSDTSDEKTFSLNMAISSCMRDTYHYARVSGLHMMECVMDTALTYIKREQLQEAANVLLLFPQLQPLVAAMGWDLLSGKTRARRKLMQILWTSKSQALQFEGLSLDNNEISCIEYLCNFLCYQLDLASFVACVNSGQSWDSKSSLLLSGKEQTEFRDSDTPSDPFVENFVLERLSAQSPLRVLFDVVPGIKFQDAIELINMQPIGSAMAAWKRTKDIELMHMRYALEVTVLALGAMERTVVDCIKGHDREAMCYLRDLQNHFEAIDNVPRKILMVNIIISLLHMDDISLNLTHCASPGSHSELSYTCTGEHTDLTAYEGGNKMVVSFISLLLGVLHSNVPSPQLDQEHALSDGVPTGGKQALEWRILKAKRFIEDWEWRLSILQRLLPLSEREWSWKEALTVLRAAPSELLNLTLFQNNTEAQYMATY